MPIWVKCLAAFGLLFKGEYSRAQVSRAGDSKGWSLEEIDQISEWSIPRATYRVYRYSIASLSTAHQWDSQGPITGRLTISIDKQCYPRSRILHYKFAHERIAITERQRVNARCDEPFTAIARKATYQESLRGRKMHTIERSSQASKDITNT